MPSHYTNNQKKFLRRLAHGAPSAMQLGKFGLTPNFYKSFETALFAHELLKLRFTNLQEERKELAAEGFAVDVLDVGGGFAADYETGRSPSAALTISASTFSTCSSVALPMA